MGLVQHLLVLDVQLVTLQVVLGDLCPGEFYEVKQVLDRLPVLGELTLEVQQLLVCRGLLGKQLLDLFYEFIDCGCVLVVLGCVPPN